MPDLFRGVAILGGWGFMPQAFTKTFSLPSIIFNIKTRITRTNISSDLDLLVSPYLKEKLSGTAMIASVGFCFGAWVAGLAMAHETFNCQLGVAIHASWKAEVVAGGSLELLASSIGTKPILFLPSCTDSDTKVDAPVVQQLAKQRGVEPCDISIEFPNQKHGWMTRANDSDPGVAQDMEKALQVTVKFIKDSEVE
jgi:dienelactone hydrolase